MTRLIQILLLLLASSMLAMACVGCENPHASRQSAYGRSLVCPNCGDFEFHYFTKGKPIRDQHISWTCKTCGCSSTWDGSKDCENEVTDDCPLVPSIDIDGKFVMRRERR